VQDPDFLHPIYQLLEAKTWWQLGKISSAASLHQVQTAQSHLHRRF